jgi:hypothetical protein
MMSKFKAIAAVVGALGIAGAVYQYFKNDLDLTFGLEEDEDGDV